MSRKDLPLVGGPGAAVQALIKAEELPKKPKGPFTKGKSIVLELIKRGLNGRPSSKTDNS